MKCPICNGIMVNFNGAWTCQDPYCSSSSHKTGLGVTKPKVQESK